LILLTGATGFIGSHTWIELMTFGMDVIGIDNFSNSNPSVCKRIQQLIGKEINFKKGDVCDSVFIESIFQEYPIHAVIHFAALKAVGESVEKPLDYYANNVMGLLNLVQACLSHQCHQFVFSSSATVYGDPLQVPIQETHPLQPTNPYGKTKWVSEMMLQDVVKANPEFHVAKLRYFNPIGAHSSGLIGEQANGIPNNLMPYLTKVAFGELDKLFIFGGDWPTHDGTGVRDYIHVTDLARGHVAALRYLNDHQQSITINLGTGKGTSVLDLIQAFEQVSSIQIPYEIVDRRAGDIAICYADPLLAEQLIGWKATYDLKQMCQDSWRWQKMSAQV
jgi:UDP-glucose 4-epimerase